MINGWEIKKLADVIESNVIGLIKNSNEQNINYKFKYVKMNNITRDNCLDLSKYTCVNATKDEVAKYSLVKNDFLFNTRNSYELVGKTCLFDADDNEFILYNNNIMRIRFVKSINPNFINYAFCTKDIARKLDSIKSGTTNVSAIYYKDLKNLKLAIPPILEQKRIVIKLDKAFAAIAKAKINVKKNLQNARELFENYLHNIFQEKGQDWVATKIEDVLQKTETIDPTKKPKLEFVYLDVSSVNKDSKEIETATIFLGKDAPSRARKLIRTNDVIFATVRPTHSRVALIPDKYDKQVCSTGYFVLRAKEILKSEILFYFLLTSDFNLQMERLQKGASYPAVTDSDVKNIIISFPRSLKEQQKIIENLTILASQTKKLRKKYQQKLDYLDDLKQTILKKAFSGDLTVSTKTLSHE